MIRIVRSIVQSALMKKIAVYGHRGFRGLLPEHSLREYKFALELGCGLS